TGVGKDVVFETVAPSQIPQAIEWDEDGDIGGYIVAEPWGSKVISAGLGEEIKLSRDIWPEHPCCVVAARDEIIQKYPEAVQELTTSLVKSGKLLEEKKDTAIKIGASFLKQDLEVMKMVLDAPVQKLSTKRLLPVLDELETMQNYLTTKVSAMSGKIDLEKFVDGRFAKSAGAL
ncbi:MAG: ABC transporter substrate-binding protein, partial [Spirochaetales bacterium]|nr:ABC transporter substrate-binding protein [Spirochaetales bacterium]